MCDQATFQGLVQGSGTGSGTLQDETGCLK